MDRPLLGWGGGCLPTHPAAVHPGRRTRRDVVLADGPTISDQTHDSYLQVAADLGVPGLLLWLGALAAVTVTGLRALPYLPAGGQRAWMVIGGLSALAGQATDASGQSRLAVRRSLALLLDRPGADDGGGGQREGGRTMRVGRRRRRGSFRLCRLWSAIAAGGWLLRWRPSGARGSCPRPTFRRRGGAHETINSSPLLAKCGKWHELCCKIKGNVFYSPPGSLLAASQVTPHEKVQPVSGHQEVTL